MLEKILFKTLGAMSKKTITRTCNEIGEELAQTAKAEQQLTPEKVMETLIKKIGKKNANKIIVTSDKDSFVKLATENGVLNEENASMFFDNSLSAVIPLAKQKKTLLSLRLDYMSPAIAVNTSTHELEHILYGGHSIRAKIEKLYVKLRGKNWLEKYMAKYSDSINTANIELQRDLIINGNMAPSAIGGRAKSTNLLEQMNLTSREELDDTICYLVNKHKSMSTKLNLKILKALKVVLQDESRAYKAGGRAERFFEADCKAVAEQCDTKSEVLADLYDLTAQTIKKKIKRAKKLYYNDLLYKTFFPE